MLPTRSAARRFPAVHASVPGPVIPFPHNHANALGRNKKMIRLRRAAAGLVVLSCAGVTASGAQPTQVAPPTVAAVAITTPVKLAAPARPAKGGSTSVYIVKLKDPGAASYKATRRSTRRSQPVGQIANAQPRPSQTTSRSGSSRSTTAAHRSRRTVAKLYSYRYALNGFAASSRGAKSRGCRSVRRSRASGSTRTRQVDTNNSSIFLGLREPGRRPARRSEACSARTSSSA